MWTDPDVTEAYRKDPDQEGFLSGLNAALAPHEERVYREIVDPPPTLHVIGAPRSGTTLLYQLIATHLDIGYINNLVAAFWRAPVHGLLLSKKLLPVRPPSSLESDFGRTAAIHEPHEFGYFWSGLLGYPDMQQREEAFDATIDWYRVKLVLGNMAVAAGRGLAFKSFLLGWHLESVSKVLPNTCFVRIRRDPVANAASLLKMRKRFLGSELAWASFRPREYEWLRHEPYYRQVAGQVYYLERSHHEQIQRVEGRNVLEVDYERLCQEPEIVLAEIRNLLALNGAMPRWLSKPPKRLVERSPSEITSRERRLIETEVASFFDCNGGG